MGNSVVSLRTFWQFLEGCGVTSRLSLEVTSHGHSIALSGVYTKWIFFSIPFWGFFNKTLQEQEPEILSEKAGKKKSPLMEEGDWGGVGRTVNLQMVDGGLLG